jgi:hypothetical protein
MQERFDWVRRIFQLRGEPRPPKGGGMLALLTPPRASGQPLVVRLLLAGGTLAGLGIASAIGLCAFAVLMFAVAAIYFLATQVLGLRINFDPRAFYEHVQRQTGASYGPN